MVTFLKSVSTSETNTKAENLALQVEVKGLRELVDLYRERLTDSDWRYQELYGTIQDHDEGPAHGATRNRSPTETRWWWSDFRRNVLR